MTALGQLIDQVAEICPEAVAVEHGGVRLTYCDLAQQSDNLASVLGQASAGSEPVVVSLEPGTDIVVALVAALKAGRLFTPVDPAWPQAMQERVLRAVGDCDFIVGAPSARATEELSQRLGIQARVVIPGPDIGVGQHATGRPQGPDGPASDLAYLYFTSGSTGEPKGVVGSHQGLLHFVTWERQEFEVSATDRFSLLTPATFDPFLRDVLVPLISGATICIPPSRNVVLDSQALAQWLAAERVTMAHMVPTVFRELVRAEPPVIGFHLRHVLLAGERLKGADVAQGRRFIGPDVQLVNLYGPTETTLAACFGRLGPADAESSVVPIGRPIPDVEVIVRDAEGVPLPDGEVGELIIRSPYASHGYFHDEARTNQAFKGLGGTGPVEYRTGDMGYRGADGRLVCLGRRDGQVKVRGMKVDLTDIESALNALPKVLQSIVLADQDREGGVILRAFLQSNDSLDEMSIRAALINQVAAHAVPSSLTVLRNFPKLHNGKVDRQALLGLVTQAQQAAKPIQGTDLELRLLALWRDAFGRSDIDLHSDFLELGGHSLLAARIARSVGQEFGVPMLPSDVISNPTVELQNQWLQRQGPAQPALPVVEVSVPSQPSTEWFEASPRTRALYLAHILCNEPVAYNMPWAVHLRGPLDPDRMADAVAALVKRHESLTSGWAVRDGRVSQRVRSTFELPFQYLNWSELDESTTPLAERLADLVTPFDLEHDLPIRIRLIQLGTNHHVLFWDIHHVAADGVSEELLKRDLEAFYQGTQPVSVTTSCRAVAAWTLADDADRWQRVGREQMDRLGTLQKLDLSSDYRADAQQTNRGATRYFALPEALVGALGGSARRLRITRAELFFAAYTLTLSRYSRLNEFVVGVAKSGRFSSGLEQAVGVFMSTQPVRCHLNPEGSLAEAIRTAAEELRVSLALGPLPGQSAQEINVTGRNPGIHPFFDVVFAYQDFEGQAFRLPGLTTQDIPFNGRSAKYDLSLYIHPRGPNTVFHLEYCTDLFHKRFPVAFAKAFIAVLRQIAAQADQPWADLTLVDSVTAADLPGVGTPDLVPPRPATIHGCFEAAAQADPDRIAVCWTGGQLTYSELNARAEQIADGLRARPVSPGARVGVMVRRGPDLLAALLGVLKAGVAYVPLDPQHPKARLDLILETSGCDLVLTDAPADDLAVPALNLADLPVLKSQIQATNADPEATAYVIYTSGSTGKPKGVEITHRNVVNFIEGITAALGLDGQDRFCCLTTVSFDIFVLESFLPLALGAVVVMADEREQLDPARLAPLLAEYQATVLQTTPSRLAMLLDGTEAESSLGLIKTFVVGGEQIVLQSIEQLLSFPSRPRIFNVYGPTETCVWSTFKRIEQASDLSIGREIQNTRLYVMNDSRRLRPLGSTGELCIGGLGVAKGYVGDPDRTQAAFVPDPLHPGERIYRTGDIVRWNDADELDYLGRRDNQVKVRGYRIELGEIEGCIESVDGVAQSVVVLIKDTRTSSTSLAAFFTADRPVSLDAVKERINSQLPYYCMPSTIFPLENMPMTPNAKIDRVALSTIASQANAKGLDPAASGGLLAASWDANQQYVADVWAHLLGTHTFDLDSSFFDVGGNSLLLVLMYNAFERDHPGRLDIADIFGYPTVRRIAERLRSEKTERHQVRAVPLQESMPRRSAGRRSEEAALELADASVAQILNDQAVEPTTLVFTALVAAAAAMAAQPQFTLYIVENEGDAVSAIDCDTSDLNGAKALSWQATSWFEQRNRGTRLDALESSPNQDKQLTMALVLGSGRLALESGLFDVELAVQADAQRSLIIRVDPARLGSGAAARFAELIERAVTSVAEGLLDSPGQAH